MPISLNPETKQKDRRELLEKLVMASLIWEEDKRSAVMNVLKEGDFRVRGAGEIVREVLAWNELLPAAQVLLEVQRRTGRLFEEEGIDLRYLIRKSKESAIDLARRLRLESISDDFQGSVTEVRALEGRGNHDEAAVALEAAMAKRKKEEGELRQESTSRGILWVGTESPIDKTNWLISNMLPVQGLSLLASPPGTGKSTLAVQIALCASSGRATLGFMFPEPFTSLYITGEGSIPYIKERAELASKVLGIENPRLAIFPTTDVPQVGSRDFVSVIKDVGARFVILDTHGSFHSADENSASEIKHRLVSPLRAAANETGASFMVIHHDGKPVPGQGAAPRNARNQIRGSSAWSGDFDFVFKLTYPGEEEDTDRRRLHFVKVKAGELPHGKFLFFDRPKATFLIDSPVTSEGSVVYDTIWNVLGVAKEGATESELLEQVRSVASVSMNDVQTALDAMVSSQKVVAAMKSGEMSYRRELMDE